MTNHYLWTKLGARLQLIKSMPGANYNWLFLPGGPGLGSESLRHLTQILTLPGSIWHLDLPGDGSNITENDEEAFSHWSEALTEAVSALPNVVLVAHSTGGMYALAMPPLEKFLTGLILMDSAPDASWQAHFMQVVNQHPQPGMEQLQQDYVKKPNNETLKQLTILSSPYLFTKPGLTKKSSFLKTLPYNYKTCEWSGKYFDSTYSAKWVPKKIPTLILAGEYDQIIPLTFFINSKKFKRKNILFRSIEDAGHYPWIDNPKQIVKVFHEYLKILRTI